MKDGKRNFREFLYFWLEEEGNDRQWRVAVPLNIIILFSVVVTILEFTIGVPQIFSDINDGLLYFFIVEYVIRFTIGTNFREDVKTNGVGVIRAIAKKFKWMFQLRNLVDLLAILPILRVFKIFSSFKGFKLLRTFRLFRLFRLLRIFRIFKDASKFGTMLRGMKSTVRLLVILVFTTMSLVLLLSYGIFTAENTATTPTFQNFAESLNYGLGLMGFTNSTPKTKLGFAFASLLLLFNILFFSVVVSIVTNKMGDVMDKIKRGEFGKVSLRKHIVLCGYTSATEAVIKQLLLSPEYHDNIVLITMKDNIDISGVIYVRGDFSNEDVLKRANIEYAKKAIVFAEKFSVEEDKKTTDLRTAMTVFHIENIDQDRDKSKSVIHTIAEINNEENAELIKGVSCDEIVFKEKSDAQIIATAIRIPYITELIYDFIDYQGMRIHESPLKEIKSKNTKEDGSIEYGNLKRLTIFGDNKNWKNKTFIGFIQDDGESFLAPKNNEIVKPDDRVLYLVDESKRKNKEEKEKSGFAKKMAMSGFVEENTALGSEEATAEGIVISSKKEQAKVRFKNHIVLCGYTKGTKIVIDELLKDKSLVGNIVLISKRDLKSERIVKELKTKFKVHIIQGDFSDKETLELAHIKYCKKAVVFAEQYHATDTQKTIDLRTAMTVFVIENINPDIHTIAEIYDEDNAKIIKGRIQGDEIIYKERCDADIIANAIRHPKITNIISEMVNLEGRVMHEKKLGDMIKEFNLKKYNKYVDLKRLEIENEDFEAWTFVGIIRERKSYLVPHNDFELYKDDRIIYLADKNTGKE